MEHFRCKAAFSEINKNVLDEKCHSYTYPEDGICKEIVTKDRLVFGNESLVRARNESLLNILNGKFVMETSYQFTVSKECVAAVTDAYCRWVFPKCDQTSIQPLPKPLCRKTCEYTIKTCSTGMDLLRTFKSNQNWHVFNCSKEAPLRNGGDIPECYYSRHLNSKYFHVLSIQYKSFQAHMIDEHTF